MVMLVFILNIHEYALALGRKLYVLFCFWLLLIGPRNIEALKTFVLEEAEKAAAKAQLGEDKDL